MPKISLGVPKLPWPKKGDEPFRSSRNARSEARLDMASRTFSSYAIAYRQAAERLVSCALRSRTEYPDLAVLPVIFVYRHYLELALKNILCLGRRCSLGKVGMSKTHDLSELWGQTRLVLEELSPGNHPVELAVVERCVLEFHRHDKSSEESRYPVDKKGCRRSLQSLARVDLRNLKKGMVGVANFLDGCADGVDYMNSNCQ